MNTTNYSTKDNFIIYLILLVFCFGFGMLYNILFNWIKFVGIIFIFLTAGSIYYWGRSFYDQGIFIKKIWVFIFILVLPLVFITDTIFIRNFVWYKFTSGFAYYLGFMLGLFIKKFKN